MIGIDLFSGPGGLTIGLKKAGVSTSFAVEIEKYAAQTYSMHSPATTVLNEDIQNIDFSSFGKVDLVYGGPPCQPFSSGGLRNSTKDARNMIPYFVKAVRLLKPEAFLMENVPGLVVGERKSYIQSVIRELEDCGYYVTWQIVSAVDYGVPQKRRRFIAVGMRHRPFSFPEATHGPLGQQPYVSVSDALTGEVIGTPNNSKVFYAKNPSLRPNPYHGQLFNGGGRAINLAEPSPTILASAGGNKTHFFDTLNLVPEYHSHLKNGGKPKVGSLPGARRLTVRESAMLQTFPDDISFSGPISSQYTQVGDAVPPLLAHAIGKAIMEQVKLPAVSIQAERQPLQETLFTPIHAINS